MVRRSRIIGLQEDILALDLDLHTQNDIDQDLRTIGIIVGHLIHGIRHRSLRGIT